MNKTSKIKTAVGVQIKNVCVDVVGKMSSVFAGRHGNVEDVDGTM